jgi:predicted dehydrogenase
MVPDTVFDPYREGQENGIAIFRTEKGSVIRIFIGFGVYVGLDHNFAMYGTKGSIYTERCKHFTEANCFAKLESIPGTNLVPLEIPVTTKFPGEQGDAHGGADIKMARDFVECILNDTKPRVDIDLAINMALPGMIAVESARRGGELMEIPVIE